MAHRLLESRCSTRALADAGLCLSHLPGIRLGHEQAEAAAAARMERQKILERETPPTVVAIIDEVVLRRQLGTREVMAQQCQKLLDASEHPSVIVQVVRGASAGIGGALALAEGPQGTVLLSGSVLEDTVTADKSPACSSATPPTGAV